MSRRRRAVVVLSIVVLVALAAAAGSFYFGGAPPRSTIAEVVPPDADAFASAFLSPSRRQARALGAFFDHDAFEAALGGGEDPVGRLLDQVLRPVGLSHARLQAHLGPEVAYFAVADPAAADDGFGFAFALTDERAVDQLVNGVTQAGDLQVRGSAAFKVVVGRRQGDLGFPAWAAFGRVGRYLVIASSARALQASIEAFAGSSLARAPTYRAATGGLRADRVGALFLSDATASDLPGGALGARLFHMVLGGGGGPFAAGVHAERDALVVESSDGRTVRLSARTIAGWLDRDPTEGDE